MSRCDCLLVSVKSFYVSRCDLFSVKQSSVSRCDRLLVSVKPRCVSRCALLHVSVKRSYVFRYVHLVCAKCCCVSR